MSHMPAVALFPESYVAHVERLVAAAAVATSEGAVRGSGSLPANAFIRSRETQDRRAEVNPWTALAAIPLVLFGFAALRRRAGDGFERPWSAD
jgi:hypothetical protein